jgi:uncharacterized protein (DUF2147 family)
MRTAKRIPFTYSGFFAPAILVAAQPALAEPTPIGVWLNDTGRGAIEIMPCGDALCGHVVWLRDESDSKGCGRQIIGELKSIAPGLWDGGWIYSPERKKTFDVEIKPLADGTLRVTGYAGSKIFSRTMVWTPAPADLERCGSETLAKVEPQPAAPTEPSLSKIEPARPSAAATRSAPAQASAAAPPIETRSEGPTTTAEQPRSGETEDHVDSPSTKSTKQKTADTPPSTKVNREGVLAKLAEIERETGYGLKRKANGDCRLKVPFAVIDFPCKD